MAVAAHIEPLAGVDTRPLLSVVLPAHDEAGVIDGTLARIGALEGQLTHRIEVIVVSDGSADATFEDACEGGLAGRARGQGRGARHERRLAHRDPLRAAVRAR